MRIFSILLLHFLTFNFVTGACVAGISSGKVLNDWPFYNGEIIPQKLLEKNKYPVWRNLFEGQAMT